MSNHPIVTLSPAEREARRLAERRELRATYNDTTIPAIVASLNSREPGAGWQLQGGSDAPANGWTTLQNGDTGERIHLSLDEYDKRISLSGLYGPKLQGGAWLPRDVYRLRESPDPRITIACSRSGDAIAAEICRRLLPGYRLLLAEYRAYVAAETAQRDGLGALADDLEARSGGKLRLRKPQHSGPLDARTGYLSNVPGVHTGQITVSGSDYVRVEMTLSPELARELCGWLAAQPAIGEQLMAEQLTAWADDLTTSSAARVPTVQGIIAGLRDVAADLTRTSGPGKGGAR